MQPYISILLCRCMAQPTACRGALLRRGSATDLW